MLTLGILGLSEGNGHPYSWSAIVNGDYNRQLMEECGFPVIPRYLEANRDTLGIDGARVTHVWCQERHIAQHVAAAAYIENVTDSPEEMIGAVDAVLLARDDPENHASMARPFIDADVPIFIDKPLAFCAADLEYFADKVAAGKLILSSSALRYSAGVQAARAELAGLGRVRLVVAVGKKDLRKYAIHYLEGMFSLLGDPPARCVRHVSGRSGEDILYIEFENGALATVHVFMDIAPGGELTVYAEHGNLRVDHGGAYTAFRNQLVEVIRAFRQGRSRLEFSKTRNVIATLIAARESLENGGRTVALAG
ncbi:MAG: Gfo/Idh/MocA family oxidoreductase [Kiritimatiellaeota bacterium]|nr:Gfo/Idh/MocA family oxidoreductase [Kiritimatiellota bacterium]